MPVTAKICGLSTPQTLDVAIRHGASHVGFVVFPPSPRHIDFATMAQLGARVPGHVRAVGVFVNPDDDTVRQAVEAGRLRAIQLHKTSPERVAHLRRITGVETWAAIPVKTRTDLAATQGMVGAADRILYDAKTPDGATLPGGMGVRFDWTLLDGVRHPLPWALSGGLDAGNVSTAVRRTQATLVDVSSGVERTLGVKDVDKIAAFLQSVAHL